MYRKTQWRNILLAGITVLFFSSLAYAGFVAGNKVCNTSTAPSGKASYPLLPVGLFNELLVLKP